MVSLCQSYMESVCSPSVSATALKNYNNDTMSELFHYPTSSHEEKNLLTLEVNSLIKDCGISVCDTFAYLK